MVSRKLTEKEKKEKAELDYEKFPKYPDGYMTYKERQKMLQKKYWK